ncbi:MAG: hypothetical protein ABS948_12040 [Solibacillus sp.]
MSKLDEIKAFVEKNAAVRAELADSLTHSSFRYSLTVADSIIEPQQELKRQANRLHIISVDFSYFEEADYQVHMRFDEFSSFIDLDECKEKVWENEGATYYKYSIVIDNLVLFSVKKISNEEHKNAQAI